MVSSVHVLHVDDDPSFGELVAEFLDREGDQFEISTATSANEGLEYLTDDSHAVDCIVSDFDMPHTSGIEFLEDVRDDHPELPFILFTGKGSEDVASDAISAGATDYLQKGGGTDQYTVLANRIHNAVDQYRSRRRAAEHERITDVMRDLHRALVYADTVEKIERGVCEILSDADPYLTACIAGVDPNTMQIEPRTWAGKDAGYFETLDMCIDANSPGRHAPGGRAYHEREIAISQNIPDDPEYEEWRKQAIKRGFRALAVVPLEHNDGLYGLLAVFADRRYAFDEQEQELLAELGDDIAHAMHAQQVQADLRNRDRAINEAPVGVTITDPEQPDNPTVYVNDEFTKVTGYTPNDILGENHHRILQGPETNEEPVAEIREAIDSKERVTVELRNYRKNGDLFWNRVSVAPVYDSEGELANYIGFQEGVTDRKESEQQLRRNELRFEALFNDPNLLVGLLETDGTVVDVNETAVEYIEADRDAVIGEPFWTTPWWGDEMRPVISEKVEQAAAGRYVEYDADLTKPNGNQYSVTGVIRPVTDESGDVVSLIVSARDVTDRVSRERILDSILEHTTVPMFLKSRAGEYILVNDAFRSLFNLDGTDVHGQTDADLFDREMASEVQKNDRRVLETGDPLEIEERIIVDGDERVYLSSKTPVYDIGTASDPDSPVAIFGVASDITDRGRPQSDQ
ncbi:PAS domain-containing protein [Haloplanus pelagicus]|uniref:GAF domain-containing protein n=1 Tax=Haloplanus pelagicus TaxID=2949995 RepID=UPI003CE52FAB